MPTIFKHAGGWINLDTLAKATFGNPASKPCIYLTWPALSELEFCEATIDNPDDIVRLTATLDKMAKAHWANDPPQAKPSKLDPEWIGANDKERQLYDRALGIVANGDSHHLVIEAMADLFQTDAKTIDLDAGTLVHKREANR